MTKWPFNRPIEESTKHANFPKIAVWWKWPFAGAKWPFSHETNAPLDLGRLLPLDKLPATHYCSPLGLAPKLKDSAQTDWRRIFDLSCPRGKSVNDGIKPEYGALQYESFEAALDEIRKLGKNTVMVKRGLKSAFRYIPVCVDDHNFLVFEWNGKFYIDLFLPFGLRTAPFISLRKRYIGSSNKNTHGFFITSLTTSFPSSPQGQNHIPLALNSNTPATNLVSLLQKIKMSKEPSSITWESTC